MKKKSQNSTEIFIIRHAETVWNSSGILQGRKDSALSQKGYEMAQSISEKFKNHNIAFIGTSPLLRSKITGYIIGQSLGVRNLAFEELNSRNFGPWEGLTLSHIRSHNDDLFKEMLSWNLEKIFLKSPINCIETYSEIYERVIKLLKNFATIYVNQNILLVTHNSVITALLLGLKISINEIPMIEFDGLLHLTFDANGVKISELKGLEIPEIKEKNRKRFFVF